MTSVLLYTCPASLPFNMAVHSWLEVHPEAGNVQRWEVTFNSGRGPQSWGHLSYNGYAPGAGIEIVLFSRRWYWRSKLIGRVDDSLLARRIQEFLAESPLKYPFCYKYNLWGPNSNTYIQWVIRHFPESGLQLPWNAIGKVNP